MLPRLALTPHAPWRLDSRDKSMRENTKNVISTTVLSCHFNDYIFMRAECAKCDMTDNLITTKLCGNSKHVSWAVPADYLMGKKNSTAIKKTVSTCTLSISHVFFFLMHKDEVDEKSNGKKARIRRHNSVTNCWPTYNYR